MPVSMYVQFQTMSISVPISCPRLTSMQDDIAILGWIQLAENMAIAQSFTLSIRSRIFRKTPQTF